MTFNQVVILVLYICKSIEYSGAINEAHVKLFRQFCPYTNFCSINSSLVLGQADITPCCMDCFCDSTCMNYGDCCPDLMLARTKSDNVLVQPVCKEALYQNEFSKIGEYLDLNRPMYRVIDQCPSEYKDTEKTRERCAENYTGPTTYDDIVMVSADDFRLFQNKHCARCHGVKQTTRWNLLITTCKNNLELANLVASEAESYILQNCILRSSRPTSVPLNGRTIDCQMRSTCTRTVDENTQEACVNGPLMPYRFDSPLGNSWYRNVMCLKCSYNNELEVAKKCRKQDLDPSKANIQGLHILLNLRPDIIDVTVKGSDECGEAEAYDKLSGDCRRMYCPPYLVVHYGRCVPISKQILNLYVGLKIIFTPEDKDLILNYNTIYPYNQDIEQFYIDRIRKKLNLKKCLTPAFNAYAARKPSSDRVEFLTVGLIIYIDDNCSLKYLGNHIQNVQTEIRQTWLINNDTIPMKGRYYFDFLADMNSYQKDTLLYKADNFGITFAVERFFVCPYFSLSVAEYNERVANKDSKYITKIDASTISTLENGYYALSETAIAVCVPAQSGGYFFKPSYAGILLLLLCHFQLR